MLRKCLFCMLLFIGIVHFALGEEIYPKDFYITPRIGFSTLTGAIGIELQHKHVAFDIGYFMGSQEDINHYLTFGIKYYIKPQGSTSYIGLAGVTDFNELDAGVIYGYRWKFWKHWDFSLGFGFFFSDTDAPMIDLAFGYSF